MVKLSMKKLRLLPLANKLNKALKMFVKMLMPSMKLPYNNNIKIIIQIMLNNSKVKIIEENGGPIYL